MTDMDFEPFIRSHPAMWLQMADRGWNTLEGLSAPVIEYRLEYGPHKGEEFRLALRDWKALLALRHVGPRRVLALVNFLRVGGVELSWFASWDENSANWTALEGCRRAEPR